MIKITKLTILIFVFATVLLAADNPFVSEKPSKKLAESIQYPVFVQKILSKIAPIQHKLTKRLTKLTLELKNKKSKKTFFIIIFISFIYGMIHALGPGHGKTITFFYFLSKQAEIKKGIIAGNLIAFLHAGSAIIIVLTLYLIIRQSYLTAFEDLGRIIKLISYALIALIGLFLSIRAFVRLKKEKTLQGDSITYNPADSKSILPIAIAIGIVPCPGAVIILLFSIAMGVLKIGIILTFFMALGMAITISSVGVMTIFTRQGVLKLVSSKNKLRNILQMIIEITSSLLILFLGVILFLVNF